jgi:hypothetical protein
VPSPECGAEWYASQSCVLRICVHVPNKIETSSHLVVSCMKSCPFTTPLIAFPVHANCGIGNGDGVGGLLVVLPPPCSAYSHMNEKCTLCVHCTVRRCDLVTGVSRCRRLLNLHWTFQYKVYRFIYGNCVSRRPGRKARQTHDRIQPQLPSSD